jgi:hypothetical protein
MCATLLSVSGAIQTVLSLSALVFTIVAALRSPAVTSEDLERASMRSMSWPSAGEN